MAGNICKDRKEFFKTVLESLRGTDSGYCNEYEDFDSIPRKEWQGVLEEYVGDVLYENITEKNVDVDFENVGDGGQFTNGGLKGLKKLSTGELFYCFDCGGDWEVPVNAIIYVEDGKVKFHVPERGNNFDVEHKCAYGSENSDESSLLADENMDNKIDRDEEMKEIEEFLHRSDSEGDAPEELKSLRKQVDSIIGARNEAFSNTDANGCYCVTTSVWCMRQGSNGKPSTICANSSNAYPNVFKTYDEALEYVHVMMMVNHNDKLHNWDKFKERISMVDGTDAIPEHAVGYVHHPMANGVERFEGFDVSGQYPCLLDDFIITKRSVKALKNGYSNGSIEQSSLEIEPIQAQHFIKGETVSEFTAQEQDEHQKDMDRIVGEMGGIESLFKDGNKSEFDRMKSMLGWDDEDVE